MNSNTVAEQVREVIAQTLGVPESDVVDSTSPATLQSWDSLHHLTLVVALEDRFNIGYSSTDIPEMNSFEAIVRLTTKHLQARGAHP